MNITVWSTDSRFVHLDVSINREYSYTIALPNSIYRGKITVNHQNNREIEKSDFMAVLSIFESEAKDHQKVILTSIRTIITNLFID